MSNLYMDAIHENDYLDQIVHAFEIVTGKTLVNMVKYGQMK